MNRRVVITGLGVISPFGVGRKALWAGLRAGRSTAAPIRGFDASLLPTRFACELPAEIRLEELISNRKSLKTMGRETQLAVAAGALCVSDAGLSSGDVAPERLGVALGVSGMGLLDEEFVTSRFAATRQLLAEVDEPTSAVVAARKLRVNPLWVLRSLPNFAATHLAINHEARGPCTSIATACTSATQALGEAMRAIRTGAADAMLAGGAAAPVCSELLIGFSLLRVLSTHNDDPAGASRPFDRDRDGFVLGDGGAVMLLEERDQARARGARIYAEVAGYGLAQDAFRLTDEPEDGRGSVQAMRAALADAGVEAEAIDYVNAHGTGTRQNDRTETRALRAALGAHAARVPVSSTKSMLGHLLSAAGAVEVAACLFALTEGCLPPTINLSTPDPECDLDYVANRARPAQVSTLLKSSFGFGGQNACLVLRRSHD